ncbi:MAG: BrnT family toxin [Candidatus Rokuibacteriota bacterium]
MTYEWDPVKAAANVKKHRVTFEEAASVFLDSAALTFWDPDHSEEEDREITIGRSARQRVLFVAHAAHEGNVRIISARRATRREQRQYEEPSGEATQ